MNILTEVYDKDVGEHGLEVDTSRFRLRQAARALVFDDRERIAFLNVSEKKFHKLPGGGIEEGETIIEALKREVLEEVGCEIEINKGVGIIVEYRNKFKLIQLSYCYLAEVNGKVSEPKLTSKELADGFKVGWMTLENAANRLETDTPLDYEGKFIKRRDLEFLMAGSKDCGGSCI